MKYIRLIPPRHLDCSNSSLGRAGSRRLDACGERQADNLIIMVYENTELGASCNYVTICSAGAN